MSNCKNMMVEKKKWNVGEVILDAIKEAEETPVVKGLIRSWDVAKFGQAWEHAIDEYIEQNKQSRFENELCLKLGRVTISVYNSRSKFGRKSCIQVNITD